MTWDWNIGLTFPISLPLCRSISALLGVSTSCSPITHSEPSPSTSTVWGLIHQHVLWASWFEKPHSWSLEHCNSLYRGWVNILPHDVLVISEPLGKCTYLTIIQCIWAAKSRTKSGWRCVYIIHFADRLKNPQRWDVPYLGSHLALHKLTEERINYFVPSINCHKILKLVFTLRAVKLSHTHSDLCICFC